MSRARKRRAFFSFHYQRDLWRVNQIRNSGQSWLNKEESYGFWDGSLWESAKRQGDAAIKRLIDQGMCNTSVTVVLIGAETSQRKYVGYEIQQSHANGKGLLGVYINRLRDQDGFTSSKGENPFGNWHITRNGRKVLLSEIYPTYDWVLDDGYHNLGSWVEKAAVAAGR